MECLPTVTPGTITTLAPTSTFGGGSPDQHTTYGHPLVDSPIAPRFPRNTAPDGNCKRDGLRSTPLSVPETPQPSPPSRPGGSQQTNARCRSAPAAHWGSAAVDRRGKLRKGSWECPGRCL